MKETEQRQEYRLVQKCPVFVELPSTHWQEDGKILLGQSLDLSANGLRVIVDRELAANAIVRLSVRPAGALCASEPFLLVAEIKWSQPWGEEGEYLIGLSLFESDGTHIQRWKQALADSLRE